MSDFLVYDSTLRDGSHALKHQLKLEHIENYTKLAEACNIDIVEVGHGNGLSGSSYQVGFALHSDKEMLECARANLKNTKLSTLVLPGFASIESDIKPAIDYGVDIFRVAVHCSEATLASSYIEFLKSQGKTVYVALMMSHMISTEGLLEQAKILFSHGADTLFLFDSSGYMTPNMVKEKVAYLKEHTKKTIAFHAHNNLGLAVANTLASLEAGGKIIDACSKGFGAGAGNTQMESIISVLDRENYDLSVDLYGVLDLAEYVESNIIEELPHSSTRSVLGGYYGVFSGFMKRVEKISKEYGVDSRLILKELGEQNIIAGQEDMIIKIALQLKGEK